VHLGREVTAHHATDVRSETVPHALYLGGARPVSCQVAVQKGRALGHQTRVAQGRQVARELGKGPPVDREDVVVAALRICCNKNKLRGP
jgi:hypothetical protein